MPKFKNEYLISHRRGFLGVPRRARMPLERVTLRITRNSSEVSKTVTSAITPVPSLS